MTERLSRRQMTDGTIFLFNTTDSAVYMHPEDTDPKTANKQKHYGHNDWQTPDITILNGIFNKLDKGEFSKPITKSFNKSAIYATNEEAKLISLDDRKTIAVDRKDKAITTIDKNIKLGNRTKIRPIRIVAL